MPSEQLNNLPKFLAQRELDRNPPCVWPVPAPVVFEAAHVVADEDDDSDIGERFDGLS